jgi:hypothetical protein
MKQRREKIRTGPGRRSFLALGKHVSHAALPPHAFIYADHIERSETALFKRVCELGLEGMVANYHSPATWGFSMNTPSTRQPLLLCEWQPQDVFRMFLNWNDPPLRAHWMVAIRIARN